MQPDYNPITDGLLKAFRFIAESNARKAQGSKRKKYTVEPAGNRVHMSRCASKAERDAVRDIIVKIREATDETEQKRLMTTLHQYQVHFVPHKRATIIDNSRYTGQALRDIRAAGGGAKEKARANRRAGLKSAQPIAAQ